MRNSEYARQILHNLNAMQKKAEGDSAVSSYLSRATAEQPLDMKQYADKMTEDQLHVYNQLPEGNQQKIQERLKGDKMYNATQTDEGRTLGTYGLGLGGGALIGAMTGNAGMGTLIGGLIAWLADNFFAKDVKKASEWAGGHLRNGTLRKAMDEQVKVAEDSGLMLTDSVEQWNNMPPAEKEDTVKHNQMWQKRAELQSKLSEYKAGQNVDPKEVDRLKGLIDQHTVNMRGIKGRLDRDRATREKDNKQAAKANEKKDAAAAAASTTRTTHANLPQAVDDPEDKVDTTTTAVTPDATTSTTPTATTPVDVKGVQTPKVDNMSTGAFGMRQEPLVKSAADTAASILDYPSANPRDRRTTIPRSRHVSIEPPNPYEDMSSRDFRREFNLLDSNEKKKLALKLYGDDIIMRRYSDPKVEKDMQEYLDGFGLDADRIVRDTYGEHIPLGDRIGAWSNLGFSQNPYEDAKNALRRERYPAARGISEDWEDTLFPENVGRAPDEDMFSPKNLSYWVDPRAHLVDPAFSTNIGAGMEAIGKLRKGQVNLTGKALEGLSKTLNSKKLQPLMDRVPRYVELGPSAEPLMHKARRIGNRPVGDLFNEGKGRVGGALSTSKDKLGDLLESSKGRINSSRFGPLIDKAKAVGDLPAGEGIDKIKQRLARTGLVQNPTATVKQQAVNLGDKARNTLSRIQASSADKASKALDATKATAGNLGTTAKDVIKAAPGKALDVAKAAPGKALDVAKARASAGLNTIKNAPGVAKQSLKNAPGVAKQSLKNLVKPQGPGATRRFLTGSSKLPLVSNVSKKVAQSPFAAKTAEWMGRISNSVPVRYSRAAGRVLGGAAKFLTPAQLATGYHKIGDKPELRKQREEELERGGMEETLDGIWDAGALGEKARVTVDKGKELYDMYSNAKDPAERSRITKGFKEGWSENILGKKSDGSDTKRVPVLDSVDKAGDYFLDSEEGKYWTDVSADVQKKFRDWMN